MGCSKKDPAVAPAEAGATAATTAAAASAAASDVDGASASPAASALNPRLPLGNRLGIERASRPGPTVHPTAEEAFAAFTKAGVQLQEPKQHLASEYGARFCVGSKSMDANIGLSICEYPDATEAKAGQTTATTMFKDMKNRTVYLNKNTTMILLEVVHTPDNDAMTKKLVTAFQSL
jgi:hypothetical protein